MAHHREEAIPPVGRDGEPRWAASRQSVMAARRSAGRNGFLQAGDRAKLGRHGQEVRSRVRFRRDRSAGDDDDRKLRVLLANHPHGFKSVHSRHEYVQEQQIEISGPTQCQALSPVIGSDHAMACAFQQQADGHLDRYVVIHDQYSCQSKKFSGPRGNQVNGRLRVLPNPRVAATASPAGTIRFAVKKPGKNTIIRMLPDRQIRRPAVASHDSPARACACSGAAGNQRGSVAQIFRIARSNPGEFAERA
jgi:hypothetical protein